MTTVISDDEPQQIEIDTVKNGRARLLCHWDIVQSERIDEMTEEVRTVYEYNEVVLWWVLPASFIDATEVEVGIVDRITLEQYIEQNTDEIMLFAKGSTIDVKL
jgi:hypothetical protein